MNRDMKTEIIIKANLTDEQLDVLVSEIQSTAEMIGDDLKVESNKLSQHGVVGRSEQLCGNFCDSFAVKDGMFVCKKCGKKQKTISA